MTILVRLMLGLLLVVGMRGALRADDTKIEPVTILDGLDNPTDVVVSPSGDLFIAESGAGRIVRVAGDRAQAVVTGFPVQSREENGRQRKTGPLSLEFLGKETVIVGGGGLPDGEELIYVYDVPPLGQSIAASETKAVIGPWAAGDTSATGEGQFMDMVVARSDDGKPAVVYVACNGDDDKGWIAQIDLSSISRQPKLEPFIATRPATGVPVPKAMTLGDASTGNFLIVAQMGAASADADSVLGFYDPIGKQLLLKLRTGLHDISSIAYTTVNLHLYAVDLAQDNPDKGGLFRLDQVVTDGTQSIKAVHIVDLDRPTALAFAPNGELFVTVLGTSPAASTEKSGKLLRIGSGL